MVWSLLRSSALLCALVACAMFISPAPGAADAFGSVRGTVVDERSMPVAGASVTLTSPSTSPQSVRTDAAGQFSFPRVAFDTYSIVVAAASFSPTTSSVTVASGSVATLRFELRKKTLARVVTRATGTAAAPVSVDVISAQSIAALPGNETLAKVTETVPGIVPFSYNEPVARGFHGIAYEVDGVPVPQTTSSAFAEIIDPRNVDRLEVFTGAMPAEFGGERAGAVVSIITKHGALASQRGGQLTLSAGSHAYLALSFADAAGAGPLHVMVSANVSRSSRGLDAPTATAQHDDTSLGDVFARVTLSPTSRDTYAFDFSNQYSTFQIPLNTNQHDPLDPAWSVPGTDDNQHEYNRYANVTYTRLSRDDNGYVTFAPWYRISRVAFLPDPANDMAGAAQTSTFQDRVGKYVGLNTSWFRGAGKHNVKLGLSGSVENFSSTFALRFIDPTTSLPATFADDVVKRGSEAAAFAQDKIEISPVVSANVGLRYDHSTGFVSGYQWSPRVELNFMPDDRNVVHAYYGRLYAAPSLEDVRRDACVLGNCDPSAPPVYDLRPERDSAYEFGLAHRFSPLIHGYATLWWRSVADVLDTTQLGGTPIFTTFNSTSGRSNGVELNITGRTAYGNSYFLSYGGSESLASGISGGTFLFSTAQLAGANGFALEDHDQTHTLSAGYTLSLAPDRSRFVTLKTDYGSGYPVQFENGHGRLPAHWTIDASYQNAPPDRFGFGIDATNLLDHKYLLKVNNGFNSTQYAADRQVTAKLIVPLR